MRYDYNALSYLAVVFGLVEQKWQSIVCDIDLSSLNEELNKIADELNR